MKKRSKLVSLIILIIFGTFTLAWTSPSFMAYATYVEGPITQDTIWTLTDSPFVVSKNVTVSSGVTLTIEPGVEVRFGGDFALIVEGTLVACGTENRTIVFTSNKGQPQAGDWISIEFKGNAPSTVAYCVIEYAKKGITIADGRVEVRDSEIAKCSENGIYITGDDQVTIQNNGISENKNGILLTGNSTTGVSITENILMLNTHSGIQLDVERDMDVVILNNILSANGNGFYVSSQVSTYITRNYISNNTVGIFYTCGRDHVAYYNDIYDNEYGMDVGSNTTVNAEYNYWGHESGPYHVSLNPAGEGNPVGGDGVNLDFIFFLTAPIDYLNTPPVARLLTDKTLVSPNQIVTFIATTSSDERRVDQYLFDFGDGTNSGWTTLSIFVHKYSSVGSYNASVTVMDDFDRNSTNVAMKTIDVQNLSPLDASIDASLYKVSSGAQVPITVHVTDGTNATENAGITLFTIGGGNFTTSSGLTDLDGYFTTTFNAPNVTQTTNVRITSTASKGGYADGSDYAYITVLPPLLVDVTADPIAIESEGTSEVAAYVTYNGEPVADAQVTLWSDSGGEFSPINATTNLSGVCTFNFTAPYTTSWLNVTITATAVKEGYLDGQSQIVITVEPKILVVELVAEPATIASAEMSSVTAHVTYNMTPVSDAMVTMSSVNGTFSPETGITDSNGDAVFVFTAPETTTQLNATVTATVTKTGYADGHAEVAIIVNIGTLYVEATANPAVIVSRATSTVTVHVTCDADPMAGAVVTVWSDGGGDFSSVEAMTDSNGDVTFVFTAPETTEQLNLNIVATATKSGYTTGVGLASVTVNPGGGLGLPLILIIIAAIIVVVVVVVVLLIKFEVINVSWGPEEPESV
ncbi:MAG: right-handed parallel beta-helix repeat-containing protein [Candidatus Bathyarchaeia archaeon]